MPQFFQFVVALAATQQGGGWLFSSGNTTNSTREVPGEDIPKWAQLWAWMDERFLFCQVCEKGGRPRLEA